MCKGRVRSRGRGRVGVSVRVGVRVRVRVRREGERSELNWLCRAHLEKEESAETRETFDQDQGERQDGESPQENAKRAFQLEFDCETRKSRHSSRKILPRSLLNSCGPRRCYPIRETSLAGDL